MAVDDVALEAVGLCRRYGNRVAVDDLTFTARQGEVLGLLGPNGAGKTTAIRLLTTVLRPSSGQFSVAGIPDSRPQEIRRLIGALPESAGYPMHMSGAAYLHYHARLFGRSRNDAQTIAQDLLEEVGLADRARWSIGTYSRGMRQRLGIARALVNQPSVVFLDEPTLGLDPGGQRQVLALVREVAQRRRATVVLSTHTLPDVEAVCTKVLILGRGRVLAAGSVREVISAAAAPRSGRLRVPPEQSGAAIEMLRRDAGLQAAADPDSPGLITLSMRESPDSPKDAGAANLNAALQALIRREVPILEFELDGTRLADAFLHITEAAS